jgi:putative transposase
MAANLSITEAAQRLGLTERAIRKRCASGNLPGARRVGRTWRIPVSADPRLAETPVKEPPNDIDLDPLRAVNVQKREAALRRAGLIQEAEKFSRLAAREGIGRTDALRHFASEHHLAFRSLQRWIRAYHRDGIAGLIDKRRGHSGHGQPFSFEAQSRLKELYLHGNKRDLTTCWRIVQYEAKKNGWDVPSYSGVRRWVNENIPIPTRVLFREGESAYSAKYEPYILKDFDSIPPGSVWVGDHHQLNAWVRHRGRWIRPWLTAWIDMRTRKVMGHFLAPSPNQGTILQALRRGVLAHGLPDSVKIDNGRDYDSETFTGTTKQKRRALKKGYLDEAGISGLFNLLSIDVSFAIPYRAQSKSIERFFDTLDRQFCKFVPTYCGKDAAQKPEDLNEYLKSEDALAEAFTLETLATRVDRWAQAYDNTPHTGEGMNGATPNEMFATRTSKRVADKRSLDLLLRVWSQPLTVGKNGVRFRGMYYGQYDTQLVLYQGRTVRVAYDPDDLRRVDLYDADSWQFLTVAEQADFVRYGVGVRDEDLREAMRKKAKAKRIAREAGGPAARRRHARITDLAIEAMADRTRPEPAETGLDVRPVATPVDGQAKAVQRENLRLSVKRAVRRAAGAEGTNIPDLEIDTEAIYEMNHPPELPPLSTLWPEESDTEPEPREYSPWPDFQIP